MRKFSLVLVAVLVAALAGCAGDTTEPGGDLSTVQDLQIDNSTAGRDIVLVWSEVSDDIDGYEIYFMEDATGSWEAVGTSTTTTYTHVADNAGKYAVRAYKGSDYSQNYSNEVSTMPSVVTTTYTIYDNYCAADKPSGFIFGQDAGTTGMASDPNFSQDIYAYDDSKGDYDVSLYSGNYGTFGNGNQTYFQIPVSGEYGYCEPGGTWYGTSYELYTSDSVVFLKLPFSGGDVYYVKMRGLTVAEGSTANGTTVTFSYEYQTMEGVTVFTSASN